MRKLGWALSLLGLSIASTAPLLAGEGDEGERIERRVIVKVGDDGEEAHQTMVFIDQEGDAVDVGDHDVIWVGKKGEHHGFAFGFGPRGFLGVQLTALTEELRAHFGVAETVGVMVSRVVADSPAARAGVEVGDIITRVGDDEVGSTWDLQALVGERAGQTVVLEVWRQGGVLSLPATLEQKEMQGPRALVRSLHLDCEDDHHRCPLVEGDFAALCPEEGSCEVLVECDGGQCRCTVDGEAVDCPPGVGKRQ